MNQKGGVGKTTVSINIAAGLARAGKRVLLIDLDPQGNLKTCLPIKEDKKSMYHILIENAEPLECIHHVAINLDLISSNEWLAKAEILLANQPSREYLLSKKLKKIAKYDYIIVDCPPSMGLLSQNALVFCEEVYAPVSTDSLGVDALEKMEKYVHTINENFQQEIAITKVIPTMYDARSKICQESLKYIQNKHYQIVTVPISMNTKLKEAAQAKRSIFAYAKTNKASTEFREIVKSILFENSDVDTSVNVDIREGKKVTAASR